MIAGPDTRYLAATRVIVRVMREWPCINYQLIGGAVIMTGGTMRTAPVIRSCSGSIISRRAKIEKQSRSRVNGTRARVTPGGCWVSIWQLGSNGSARDIFLGGSVTSRHYVFNKVCSHKQTSLDFILEWTLLENKINNFRCILFQDNMIYQKSHLVFDLV